MILLISTISLHRMPVFQTNWCNTFVFLAASSTSHTSANKSPWSSNAKIALLVIGIVSFLAVVLVTIFFMRKKFIAKEKPILENHLGSPNKTSTQERSSLIIDGEVEMNHNKNDSWEANVSTQNRQESTSSTLPLFKYRHLSSRSQCSFAFSYTTELTCAEGRQSDCS